MFINCSLLFGLAKAINHVHCMYEFIYLKFKRISKDNQNKMINDHNSGQEELNVTLFFKSRIYIYIGTLKSGKYFIKLFYLY